MARKIVLSAKQRESGLMESLEYAKNNNFNVEVIEKYTTQLMQVQEELKRDKDKKDKFKRVEKGIN